MVKLRCGHSKIFVGELTVGLEPGKEETQSQTS